MFSVQLKWSHSRVSCHGYKCKHLLYMLLPHYSLVLCLFLYYTIIEFCYRCAINLSTCTVSPAGMILCSIQEGERKVGRKKSRCSATLYHPIFP
jgi:hypothetical protein